MPEPQLPRFSIVLPCYNEAETLPSIFTRFSEVVGDRDDIEVIFVNNGSKDASANVFAKELAGPGRRFARVVTVQMNKGYGYGIWAGLQEARGSFVGWTHADSQYDPAIVLDGFGRLVAAPDSANTILKGRREARPLVDAIFTTGMSVVASLALATRVSDINAQPKIFPRSFIALMHRPPQDFSLDLYALYVARRHGYRILELPVVFGRRLHGEAKGGGTVPLKWKLTKRTWAFILQLRRDARAGNL